MGSWYDVLGRRKQVNQCLKIEPGRHRHTEESDPHRMDNRSARRACFAFFNFPGKIFRKQLTIRESAGIITPVVRHGTNIWGISSAGRALAWHARGHRFDPGILHQKSTVLRRKYGAFLFTEAVFVGLHCFACAVFRLLQAVPIQPPTFDFTPFSKKNVCRPAFQQAAASAPSMYGVRSKLKVMLS